MKKPRLLIVDDEEDIRSVIRFFASERFEVLEAVDGLQALEIIDSCKEDEKIDIMLSDFNMPNLNGLELLKTLAERNSSIPVIWLTGRGSSELCRDSWALGVYDYIEKPFKSEDLLQCLAGAINFKQPFSEIVRMRGLSRYMFEFPQLVIGSGTYREFSQECKERGVAPSTLIAELMNTYLEKAKRVS